MSLLLILASASTARSKLLEKVHINHKVYPSEINERVFHHSDPRELVKLLAFAKAECVFSKLAAKNSAAFVDVKAVLGCDSLFEFEGEIFGKPNGSDEAFNRWKRMSSKTGRLHTGHALLFPEESFFKDIGKKVIDVVTTVVNFSKITSEEINKYVSSGEPERCAGGFALEERGGIFIDSISGCYSNVIGLSLPWLRKTMRANNIII